MYQFLENRNRPRIHQSTEFNDVHLSTGVTQVPLNSLIVVNATEERNYNKRSSLASAGRFIQQLVSWTDVSFYVRRLSLVWSIVRHM